MVSARLTPEDRIRVEARDPGNPNYCPACLTKAMHNHFPHACAAKMDPLEAATRPGGHRPDEMRCVCLSFMDVSWMKLDCEQECIYVNDSEAMSSFVHSKDIPGCDKYVDFDTGEEKEIEGFAKKDPTYQPETFVNETVVENESLETETETNKDEAAKVQDREVEREAEVQDNLVDVGKEATQEEPTIAEVNADDFKVQQEVKENEQVKLEKGVRDESGVKDEL
ncbi:hypothetical protein BGZ99_001007 [Dissophora globulifera]|uniref:Uncharacterized protein n=1 Tax=Dissophora globulifera TaxID=979702 RepID=A0A9P6RRW7_9FUNG|nr:hypothetical protein BGZ99_001007 [Dissophora globulifera]